MPVKSKAELKEAFEPQIKPKYEDFVNLIESYRHMSDRIPAADIQGFEQFRAGEVGVYDSTLTPSDYELFNQEQFCKFFVRAEAPFIAAPEWGNLEVTQQDIDDKNKVWFVYAPGTGWTKYTETPPVPESEYDIYVRTTTDNPVLSETDWLDSRKGQNATAVTAKWVFQAYVANAQVAHKNKLWEAPAGATQWQEPGEDTAWVEVVGGAIRQGFEFRTNKSERESASQLQNIGIKERYDAEVVPGKVGWDIVPADRTMLINWAAITYAGNIIQDGTDLVHGCIPVLENTEYINKTGGGTLGLYVVYLDENRARIDQSDVFANQVFTTPAGTRYMLARNLTQKPIIGLAATFIDEKDFGYQVKLPVGQIENIESYIDISKFKANTGSLREMLTANIKVAPGSYDVAVFGQAAHYVKAAFNISDVHAVNATTKIFSVKNEASEETLKVEFENKVLTRAFCMPKFESNLKLSINGRVNIVNMEHLKDSLTDGVKFGIRLKQKSGIDYDFIINNPQYEPGSTDPAKMYPLIADPVTEQTNYTLSTDALGWIAKWTAGAGLSLIRYNVIMSAESFTIGTTELQSYAHNFSPGENLDDYLSRIKSTLDAQGFDLYLIASNRENLCVDVLPCEIQMCQYFRCMKMGKAPYAGSPSDLLNNPVVDSWPALFHTKYKGSLDIVFYYINDNGWYTHQLIVNGTPVLEDRASGSGNNIYATPSTISVSKAFPVSEINWSPSQRYRIGRIANLTGHFYLPRPEFYPHNAADPWRYTTGRLRRQVEWLKGEGFKYISVQELCEKINSKDELTEDYFCFTVDDSPAITQAVKPEVKQQLLTLGIVPTSGINTANLTREFQPLGFGDPDNLLTIEDIEYFQTFGEIFQHCHLHNTLVLSTWMQLEYIMHMNEKVSRDNNIKITRYLALPFDSGTRYLGRALRTVFGYHAVSAYGLSDGWLRGSVTQGISRDISPRINAEDQTSDEVWQGELNKAGIYNIPIRN